MGFVPETLHALKFCGHDALAVDAEQLCARCDDCGAKLEGVQVVRAVLQRHAEQTSEFEQLAADLNKAREMVVKMASRLMDLGAFD